MEVAVVFGSPPTAFYFISPFGSQNCGCLGQVWHHSNPPQFWCVYLISRTLVLAKVKSVLSNYGSFMLLNELPFC